LREALALARDHLSLYNLTIEQGTRFGSLAARGANLLADEETCAALYETAQEVLDAAGMPAYEISNHAKPGEESRHNLAVWRGQDYLGLGPGAHGRVTLGDGARMATIAHRKPETWLELIAQDGAGLASAEILSPQAQAQELIMLGLRTVEGVPVARLKEKLGRSLDDLFADQTLSRDGFDFLVRNGFLLADETRLAATRDGRQRLNALIGKLLA
jgi:oxygen-independent coproporphyrinogen-3 oxidase